MKVTVDRQKLIDAIELRIKKETAEFEQASYAFEKKEAQAVERLIANLQKEVTRLSKPKAELPDKYNYTSTLFAGVNAPAEPKLKVQHHEAVLAKLKLSLDETLTVTDKDDYFDVI